MPNLSENFNLRKCYLKRQQVPTQSVMIDKMSKPLAEVYFKSMTPKLKVLAGLEPRLKGGGSDWYIPPEDLLKGRAVLKPIQKCHLAQLSFEGIAYFGERIVEAHHMEMEREKDRILHDNDVKWKEAIDAKCKKLWEECSTEAANRNTQAIRQAFKEFSVVYMTSLTRIESLMSHAANIEVMRTSEETFKKMKNKYKALVKIQATKLYDEYTKKLDAEKERLKAEFVKSVQSCRDTMIDKVHDLNVEKHVAIEKVRNLIQCQKLACQVYIALKERDECQKEIELSQHEHKKKIKALTQQIALNDFEIRLAREKEKKRQELINIWKKKVCEVVKKFQLFVSYCLNTLPEHAEFFTNMEKLMMIQLNEAVEQPSVESIFQNDDHEFRTPIPKPHPFILCSEKGYKPKIDQNLCPKHCTSSASQLPVVVINKRYMYAACDNFEKLSSKIENYIHNDPVDRTDSEDDHVYSYDVPIKYNLSQQLLELKLESSLLQILQQEIPNLRNVPIECCVCKTPYCFCDPLHASKMSIDLKENVEEISKPLTIISSGNKVESRTEILQYERGPKLESYFKYVEPKRCTCPKTAKKHLKENLPAYMKNTSSYQPPDLPNYEVSPMSTIRRLVMKRRAKNAPQPAIEKVESKTHDVGTQYTDEEFDFLCTCFSEDNSEEILRHLNKGCFKESEQIKVEMNDGRTMSPTFLNKSADSFATARALSLRNLLHNTTQLEEIFRKYDCLF
ncbi:uncharacterized protein LOC110386007 [Bombyx mori]|uniref:Uncharacterized protein n=1 Tax=Bombyx mori TaxID=7091 RepID=A0A8R2HPM0_BOMMO|nr:uncharacterized protein LOC110386007 [Bombyx mori]